jgi:peptide/nickel transport system substrate-binding protein
MNGSRKAWTPPSSATSTLSLWLVLLSLLVSACAPTPRANAPTEAVPDQMAPRARKTIVAAIAFPVPPLGPLGGTGPGAGHINFIEAHTAGLATSDADGRPVARLATELPSLDRGTTKLLDDGRMTTTWTLRSDATWHDGTPVRAADIVLGFNVHSDTKLPAIDRTAVSQIESVVASDDNTALITWKRPFYLADSLGPKLLWPLPSHLLAVDYDSGDKDRFQNLPFWTTQYVHAGPFRVARYDPAGEVQLEAYDSYFLGRPKVAGIIIRPVLDGNALYASVLSGDVQLTIGALDADRAYAVKDQWAPSNGGTVTLVPGATTFFGFQFAPEYVEPKELLNPKVRQALYLALDRAALTELAYGGRAEPGAEARSLFGPTDPLYTYVKDIYAAHAGDPDRAARLLSETGLTRGSDGMLVNSEGRRISVRIKGQTQERVATAAADMWKRVGVEAGLDFTPGAAGSSLERLQDFSGLDITGAGDGDRIFNRFYGPFSPTPQNGFGGNNRGHYDNPRMNDLVERFRGSLRTEQRGAILKEIADLVGEELPIMVIFYNPVFGTVQTGLRALDDIRGGYVSGGYFGAWSRSAHLWE